jgi:hypothetical protein
MNESKSKTAEGVGVCSSVVGVCAKLFLSDVAVVMNKILLLVLYVFAAFT